MKTTSFLFSATILLFLFQTESAKVINHTDRSLKLKVLSEKLSNIATDSEKVKQYIRATQNLKSNRQSAVTFLHPQNRQFTLCTTNADCDAGQQCENNVFGPCSSTDTACVCLPDEIANAARCNSENPCSSSTVCINVYNDPDLDFGLCFTCPMYEEALNTEGATVTVIGNNPCGGEVCMDAKLLAHLPAKHLVFEEHRRASVLCDVSGSCATVGHMVTYEGKPMMMGSYCQLENVSCTKKTMFVNSPRMFRGLRIPSHTEGLLFTPLSARYESAVEERVLSTLVHMGM